MPHSEVYGRTNGITDAMRPAAENPARILVVPTLERFPFWASKPPTQNRHNVYESV